MGRQALSRSADSAESASPIVLLGVAGIASSLVSLVTGVSGSVRWARISVIFPSALRSAMPGSLVWSVMAVAMSRSLMLLCWECQRSNANA